MKIVNKPVIETADISSARGTGANEFWKLVLSAIVLLVGLYYLTGFTVDLIVTRISYKNEARIFKHFTFPEVTDGKEENPPGFDKAKSILESMKQDNAVPPLPYSLTLIDHEEPNAFAFPGGMIGVTSGLLEALDEEIEIAFVIGHELGHFHNRDHLRGLGRAVGFGVIMAIFSSSSGTGSFSNLMNLVLQRNYSQDRERKADYFGLKQVYSIYGKVEGTDRLFKLINEKNKTPQWAYMFSTHPSPEERIRDLEAYGRILTGETPP
jgi:Zn-dependent protease with chaperone function